MPTSSSLVTNLPADFDTFGQGVDTSLQDLLGGTTGQVLSKTSGTNMDFTWVTPTDQTPLTTKGDLFTFSTVDARLGVGTNGQTLVADSTASTGLKWAAPSWPTSVACAVYNAGGNVTYTANVPLIQNFTTEDFDTNTMHDNSTNTSRITIPTGYAGKYVINATARFAVGIDYILIRVYKNGSAVTTGLESGELVRGYYAANAPGINGSIVLNLAVSDYIEIGIQSSGSGAIATYSRFSVTYLGA